MSLRNLHSNFVFAVCRSLPICHYSSMSQAVIKKEHQDIVAPSEEVNQARQSEPLVAGQNEMGKPTGLDCSINETTEKGTGVAEYPGPELAEVSRMRYHNLHVKIYKYMGTCSSSKYFYEPILLIDPRKIQNQVNYSTGQAYVRFTVQMWDDDVGEQVLNCLKRLPDSRFIEEDYVQMMPFEKVRLVFRESSMSSTYRLPEKARDFQHLPQHLQFHLLCETKEAAYTLAESFRADPEYLAQDLALECLITTKCVETAAANGRNCKRPRLDVVNGSTVPEIIRSSSFLNFNINNTESSSFGNQGIERITKL